MLHFTIHHNTLFVNGFFIYLKNNLYFLINQLSIDILSFISLLSNLKPEVEHLSSNKTFYLWIFILKYIMVIVDKKKLNSGVINEKKY